MEYRQPFTGEYGTSQNFGEHNHTGIDFLCPADTPILASEAGTVIHAGWKNGGYGNCVFIKHSDGNTTIYEHLNTVCVSVGQTVKRSQVIGYSGSTGNSTGPHLHFEIQNSAGKPFDPMTVLHSSIEHPVANKPELKGADALGHDVEIVAPAGAWGWNSNFSQRATVFPCGTKLTYTGRTTQRLGYTYCECYPEPVKYWVAVNDGETQILANQEENGDH